jgi:hypothetical protein
VNPWSLVSFFSDFFLSGVGDECVFGYKLVKKFINDC